MFEYDLTMVTKNSKLFEETSKLVINICNKISSYKPSEKQLEKLIKNRQKLYYPNQNEETINTNTNKNNTNNITKNNDQNVGTKVNKDNINNELDEKHYQNNDSNNIKNQSILNSNSLLKNVMPKKTDKQEKRRIKEEKYNNPKNYQGIDKFTNSNCNNSIRYKPKTFFFQ